MITPYWVQDAIFYQIFPDRFANGDPDNDPPNVQPWGSPPSLDGFQGGDLRGVIQRFDYLLDLGINALYFNPIFASPSTHRYNTSDYYQIDPKLGTLADFRALLEVAHRNHVRVVLDGVFNHCGRGFFAFADVLENGENSAYRDWFHIRQFPLEAYTPGEAHNYLGWWNHKSLPKFNTENPLVRRYLLDVAHYWIEQGIDGWRLDVPNEIDDDEFWAEFRQVVKSANRDAYILGEIWTADPRWVGDEHFDGLMNYPVRDALLRLLYAGTLDMPHFIEKVEGLLSTYARENVHAMFVPLGSHDTERLFTKVEGSTVKAKLAFLFQMAYPGAPAVYYGDEIGLQGGKDPDCRRAFPWDQSQWNLDLQSWVRTLIALRKANPALCRGDYRRMVLDNQNGHYVFVRELGEQRVVVAINASESQQTIEVPCVSLGWTDGNRVQSMIDARWFTVQNGMLSLSLAAWSGAWIG
ncbi:MAG: glycoside hydrolase family 13 protein [Anaerolineales bacterium]|nr:glycoside hydrolase family 13 protein [Anaerolineales bacterium]